MVGKRVIGDLFQADNQDKQGGARSCGVRMPSSASVVPVPGGQNFPVVISPEWALLTTMALLRG